MSTEVLTQSAQLTSNRKQIAILDFGSQYSHLIARRIREHHVFCELYSCLVEASTLTAGSDDGTCNIVGVILSGGPSSVYDPESPHVHPSGVKNHDNSKNNNNNNSHNEHQQPSSMSLPNVPNLPNPPLTFSLGAHHKE